MVGKRKRHFGNFLKNDSADFSIYVWTNGGGESSIELELFDIAFPNENMILNLTFYINETIHISNEDSYLTENNLLKSYPNPFNSFVVFEFVLEYDSHVKIDIYNINGKHVNTLFNNFVSSGKRSYYWDSKCKNGFKIPSGIYFGSIETQNKLILKKIIYAK